MDKFTRFLWKCSGASSSLIEECPTESSKYAGIGATILFTGLFASLAGGYAIYTVFDNIFVAAFFGILWGLMIFNLDRYIVSGMRKKNKSNEEFKAALPRIILAILIAIVISKPLELKIFEKEIETELVAMEQAIYKNQEELVESRYQQGIQKLEREVQILKAEIEAKTTKRDQLKLIAQQEADGTGGSKTRNLGPIYKVKKADADAAEQELRELTTSTMPLIRAKLLEITALKADAGTDKANLERKKYDGLAARLDALSNLTEKSPAINIANWFILLLFIAIELSPVFVKLISAKGPYDNLLEVEEHRFETERLDGMAKQCQSVRKKSEKMPNNEQIFVEEGLAASLQ